MNDVKENNNGTSSLTIKTVKDVMENIIKRRKFSLVFPEFPDQDALWLICSKVMEPKLIILASRPGLGKTTLALHMLCYIAIAESIPSALFSLEMDAYHIGLRLLSLAKTEELSKAPIIIVDEPNMSISKIHSRIQYLVSEDSVKTVFIDYLGLIHGDEELSRKEQITEIRKSLKNMARELGVSIVALEQISRESKNIQRDLEIISLGADTVFLLDGESGNLLVKTIKG